MWYTLVRKITFRNVNKRTNCRCGVKAIGRHWVKKHVGYDPFERRIWLLYYKTWRKKILPWQLFSLFFLEFYESAVECELCSNDAHFRKHFQQFLAELKISNIPRDILLSLEILNENEVRVKFPKNHSAIKILHFQKNGEGCRNVPQIRWFFGRN